MVSLGVAVCLWKKRNQKRAAGLLAVLSLALYLLSIGAVSDRLMGSLEQTYEVPAHPEGDVSSCSLVRSSCKSR